MKIELHPRHFEDGSYMSIFNCPIARALKEKFPAYKEDIAVGDPSVDITGINSHKIVGGYGFNLYSEDVAKIAAGQTGVIRTIEIRPIKKSY